MPHGFDFANAKSLRMDSNLGGFGWMKKIRFDSFVSLNRGFDLPDDKIIEGEYPVIASTSIKAYHNQFKVKAPIVVTGRSGSLGKVQYIDRDGWPLNTSLYAKDYHGNFPKYVYYFLQTMHLEQFNAGAGVPTLNQNHLHSLKLLVHEREQQELVANILSRYDEAIDNNNKRIKLLEQMAQNLYKEWFVRFRFPGYENCEFENGIPVGWNFQKLEDFGIVLESGSRPSGGVDINLEEGIPSLGAECIKGLAEFDYSNIKYIPLEFYDKMKRGKNKGNHILLYKDGAYIGKVSLFRNQFPFKKYAINEHVFFLNSKNGNYLNWLFFTLKQDSYFNLMQNLNRNAAQPGLSQPDICRIKIRIPQEDIVIKFNQIVEPILNTVFYLAKANKNLAKQRDLLLPRLMSGKLEVN